ncbi:hypothetical protein ACWEVO_30705, partial [Micromonospora sp. NPDC003776]
LWVGPRPAGEGTVLHPALAELDVPAVLAAVDRVERAAALRRPPAPRSAGPRRAAPAAVPARG